MVTNYVPQNPDNASVKASLEELKKLNASSTSYNKLTVAIASAALIVSIASTIITLWR